MNVIKHRFTLETTVPYSQVTVHTKKDNTVDKLIISLTENRRSYELTEELRATFVGKKPDGTIIFNDCKIVGNSIEYTLTEQTSAAVGVIECELRIYSADKNLLTSPRFTVVVDEIIFDSDKIQKESENEFGVLDNLIFDVQSKQDKWVSAPIDGENYVLKAGVEYTVVPSDSYMAEVIVIVKGYSREGTTQAFFGISFSDYEAGEKVSFKLLEEFERINENSVAIAYELNGKRHTQIMEFFAVNSDVGGYEFGEVSIATNAAYVLMPFENYILEKAYKEGYSVDMSNYYTKTEVRNYVNKAIPDGYVTTDDLNNAVEYSVADALEKAKATGVFNGPIGPAGPQGIPGTAAQVRINQETQIWEYANEYDEQGNPIWVSSDLKAVGEQGPQGETGPQGSKGEPGAEGPVGPQGPVGAKGADGKTAYAYAKDGGYTGAEADFAALLANAVDSRKITLGLHTDGLLYVFINGSPVGNGIALSSGASGDVIGNLDSNNNIVLTGDLADGTYTLKYENEDGTYTDIGTLEVGEVKPAYTNLADPTSDEWIEGYRISSSGVLEATAGVTTVNTIAVGSKDVVRVKGMTGIITALYTDNGFYARKTVNATNFAIEPVIIDGDYTEFTPSNACTGLTSIRFYGALSGTAEDVIITVNQEIV